MILNKGHEMFRLTPKHFFLCGILILLSFLIVGCSRTNQTNSEKPQLPLQPCQLSAPGFNMRLPAQCGNLTIPENRLAQSGRQITLHVAMIPAVSRTPAPDPVFFITGGPGEASTQDYVVMSSAFRRLNEKRDIVMMDQRGTGKSHPLKCDISDQRSDESESDDAAIKSGIQKGLAQLDADTRFYNTQAAVEDLDQVRAALGYDKINLYGISYGTRVVQTYLRSYPKHVRTIIMDGVVPQDEPLGISISSDAQKALNAIFTRCAAETDCGRAFPNLPGALDSLFQRVEKQPVHLTIEDPYTGKPREVRFTRNQLGMAIRLHIYRPETAALLPLLIHDADKTGDLRRLAAQAAIVTEQLQGSINMALHHSVVCAEDVPFFMKDGRFVGDVQAEKQAFLGEAYKDLQRVCRDWPAAQVPASFKDPIRSSTPALLLSGELDPVTPPENARHVSETLSNSLQVVAPGQGHGILTRGCVSKIAADFVERGSVTGLDTACVQKLGPASFFLSYTGPKP